MLSYVKISVNIVELRGYKCFLDARLYEQIAFSLHRNLLLYSISTNSWEQRKWSSKEGTSHNIPLYFFDLSSKLLIPILFNFSIDIS